MAKSSKKTAQITRAVIQTAAGMVVTKPTDLLRLAAHAGDEMLKRNFSQALYDTYAFFINKGKIDEKYFNSRDFADLAPEFGRIQKNSYSQEKLDKLRKILTNIAIERGKDAHKKYLLDIALSMEEPEIVILLADYFIAKNPSLGKGLNNSAASWQQLIAENSTLKHAALVGLYSEKLETKMLISGRTYSDKSGISWQAGISRLTSMGIELCEIMQLEDDPINNKKAPSRK